MKAACFSVAAMDYFPRQEKHFAGGNALNQAIRFRELGWESAFLGALGTDQAGDRIEKLLRDRGVDCTGLRRILGETASNVMVNDVTGERFAVDGAWKNGVYNDFVLSEQDWGFLDSIPLWTTHANGVNYSEALRRKDKNRFLAVDFLHYDDYSLLKTGMDILDIAYFGGVREQEIPLRELSRETETLIVLTLGAEGSIAFHRGEMYRQEALPLAKVVDTTGCGDAFQAACSASFFLHRDIAAALEEGADRGSRAAEHYGGVLW